jgi:hypothetical protein
MPAAQPVCQQQFLVGGFKQIGAVDLQGIADDL